MNKINRRFLVFLMLFSAPFLFAGGQQETSSEKEPVKLVWYIPGGGKFPYQDAPEVYAELNKMLIEDLGVEVEFKVTGQFGEYKETMPLAMAAGEKFDIVWTSSWCNDFLTAANDGYYAGLDTLLEENAPTIWKDTKDALAATVVDGEIRGVWSQQIAAKTSNFQVRDRMVEAYGWDIDSVKTPYDLEPFLADIKANEPEIIPISTRQPLANWMKPALGFVDLNTLKDILAVKVDDNDMKVFNLLDNEDYKDMIELSRDWFEKGYIAADGLTYNNDQWNNLKSIGRIGIDFHNTWKPGMDVQDTTFGEKLLIVPFEGPSIMAGSGITSTLNAVSSQSEHQVEAVKFLEYLWTNEKAYNLLTWGIEGKHHTLDDNGFMTINEDSGYVTGLPWVFGNTFISHPKKGDNPEANALVYDLNQNAEKSPLMGFVLDLEPIKNDVAALTSVVEQYNVAVVSGYMGEDLFDEYQSALDAAGIDRVIKGIQSQIDAWAAAK